MQLDLKIGRTWWYQDGLDNRRHLGFQLLLFFSMYFKNWMEFFFNSYRVVYMLLVLLTNA